MQSAVYLRLRTIHLPGNSFPMIPQTSSSGPDHLRRQRPRQYPDGKLMLRKAESEDEEFMHDPRFQLSIHQYCDRTRRMPLRNGHVSGHHSGCRLVQRNSREFARRR